MNADVTYFGTVYPAECDHMGHLNPEAVLQKALGLAHPRSEQQP